MNFVVLLLVGLIAFGVLRARRANAVSGDPRPSSGDDAIARQVPG